MMEILYKKKVIRDFLSIYSNSYWNQLVSHLLEYGIILFKKKYTVSSLSPDDIFKIVENFKKEEGVYDKKFTKRNVGSSKGKNFSRSNSKNRGLSSSKSSNSKTKSFCAGKSSSSSSLNKKKFQNSFSSNNSTNKGVTTPSNKKKVMTPSRQKSDDLFKFKTNHPTSNNTLGNNANSKPNVNSERTKSRSKSRTSFHSNTANISNVAKNIKKEIAKDPSAKNATMLNALNIYSNLNDTENTLTHNTTSNISTIKKKPVLSVTTKQDNEEKLIHFENTHEEKPKKIKAESKIKALIEKDKQKYLKEKYSNLALTLNNNTNPTVLTNEKMEPDPMPAKNESSIISLEDKLNGLTMKLSKLNASINNNNPSYLSSNTYTNSNNLYTGSNMGYTNIQNVQGMQNTPNMPELTTLKAYNNLANLRDIQTNTNFADMPSYLDQNNNIVNNDMTKNYESTSNQVYTSENNQDEDYLGEDQIDLGSNENTEMRYYRKTDDE